MNIDSRYFYLSITLLFKIGINILLIFYVAKNVSVTDFGAFSLAFLIYSLCVLFIDYGFNLKGLILNKIEVDKVNYEISSMILAKILLVLVLTVIMVFFFSQSNYNVDTNSYILILSLAAIPNSFGLFFLNKFKIINKYDKEAKGFFLQGFVLLLSVVIFTYFKKTGVLCFVFSILLSKIVFFIYGLFSYLNSDYFTFKMTGLNVAVKSIRYSFPFATHLILGALIIYIDTIVLSSLSNLSDVALYQSGMRIIMASLLVSVILSDAFIPIMSNLNNNTQKAQKIMLNLFELVLVFLILLVITLFYFKNTIILLLYSLDYVELERYFLYIIGIITLRYIGIVPGILLTSSGKQNIRAKAVIFSVVCSVILNYLFIPLFNIEGAFLSSFFAHLILNIIYLYYALKVVNFINFKYYNVLFMIFVFSFGLQYFLFSDSINFFITTIILNIVILIGYVFFIDIHKIFSHDI